MDTTVSRMIRFIGALLVTGFVVNGIQAAQAGNWGNTHGFMWGGLGAGVIFTLTWTITKYQMTELLGTRKREEFTTDSIIGLSIAILALLSAIGFVSAGIAAAYHQQWNDAHWFLWGGNFAGLVLSIIWSVAEYNFVERAKK